MTERPLQILLVEDNPGDARLVAEMLRGRADLTLEVVDCLAAGLARLAEAPPDVVLLDLELPDSRGLDTLRAAVTATRSTAVVVLTGLDDDELGRAAIQEGAADYLVKGRLTDDGLLRALRYGVGRHAMQARLHHLNEVLRAIRNVNQLIVREREPRRLLARACELLVEARHYRAVWLAGMPDAAGPPSLASTGWGDAFGPFEQQLLAGRLPACWGRARAAATGLAVLDPARDCGDCPLWTAYGHHQAAVAPLRHRDRDLGTLGICVAHGDRIDDEEASLLIEVADDLGLALYAVEIERQHRDYATIVAGSRDAMALLSPEHRFREVNPSYERLVGRCAAELRGNHPADVLGGEFFERVMLPRLDECLAGREARVETVREMPGQGTRHLEAAYSPCFAPDGSVAAVAACIRDVTALRHTETALQAERDNLRAVTEATPVALLMFDEERQLSFANPAAERLFGRRLEGLEHRRCGDFLACVHRADVPQGCGSGPDCVACVLDRAVRDVLRDGRPIRGREALVEMTGERLHERMWLHVDVAPLVVADRGHCVMALLDVTARHRAEEARDALEEQLRASQRMEAIGTLAGGLAHDFNNLLSVILSYTEFALERARPGEPAHEELTEVLKAGRRGESLVRQLLAFSRKQVLQPVALNLNDVVADLERLVRRAVGEHIELVLDLGRELDVVMADPGQLEQMLINLAINARDAMPEGGRLTIQTSNVDLDDAYAARHLDARPGPHVRLTVTDTGCGMDAQSKARLLEPFFTTKPRGKGTGLGLSMVYGIVRQSGGDIQVDSEPGRGSSFRIHLPRVRTATAGTVRPPPPQTLPGGHETVLVVDDEASVREVTRRVLKAAGYRVLTAADGEEGLATAAAYPDRIHLLLADVIMPRMDGRALAERLTRLRPGIKVLFTSGYTDDAIARHGDPGSGLRLLAKPFTARSLVRRVRELLDDLEPAGDGRDSLPTLPQAESLEPPPGPPDVRGLSSTLLDRLRRATTAARHDELLALIAEAHAAAPETAAGLRRLAEGFDYAALRAALDPPAEGGSDDR